MSNDTIGTCTNLFYWNTLHNASIPIVIIDKYIARDFVCKCLFSRKSQRHLAHSPEWTNEGIDIFLDRLWTLVLDLSDGIIGRNEFNLPFDRIVCGVVGL